MDMPLVAVIFHEVDEKIGRGVDCVAYEPYAARKCLWLVSVSVSVSSLVKSEELKNRQ
jgi:hypothetical protein